jgi:hypothetical protein
MALQPPQAPQLARLSGFSLGEFLKGPIYSEAGETTHDETATEAEVTKIYAWLLDLTGGGSLTADPLYGKTPVFEATPPAPEYWPREKFQRYDAPGLFLPVSYHDVFSSIKPHKDSSLEPQYKVIEELLNSETNFVDPTEWVCVARLKKACLEQKRPTDTEREGLEGFEKFNCFYYAIWNAQGPVLYPPQSKEEMIFAANLLPGGNFGSQIVDYERRSMARFYQWFNTYPNIYFHLLKRRGLIKDVESVKIHTLADIIHLKTGIYWVGFNVRDMAKKETGWVPHAVCIRVFNKYPEFTSVIVCDNNLGRLNFMSLDKWYVHNMVELLPTRRRRSSDSKFDGIQVSSCYKITPSPEWSPPDFQPENILPKMLEEAERRGYSKKPATHTFPSEEPPPKKHFLNSWEKLFNL